MQKEFVKICTTALGVTGTGINFIYKLVKTNDVSIIDLNIGHTPVDLDGDRNSSDSNTFESKSTSQYMGFWESDGILVTAAANGKAGGNWLLTVSVNGIALTSNPIKENTDNIGNLDHNGKHK